MKKCVHDNVSKFVACELNCVALLFVFLCNVRASVGIYRVLMLGVLKIRLDRGRTLGDNQLFWDVDGYVWKQHMCRNG